MAVGSGFQAVGEAGSPPASFVFDPASWPVIRVVSGGGGTSRLLRLKIESQLRGLRHTSASGVALSRRLGRPKAVRAESNCAGRPASSTTSRHLKDPVPPALERATVRADRAMTRSLPSGTVTFLFTDVEGSTSLLRDLGSARYAEALADHRRILRTAFAAHGGVEVDTQGDAFFVAFPTAPGALAAAAEARDRLAGGPVGVRMGIHTGTPHLTGEGYVGIDVHRAARIAAAGHGGQVLVSASTAALLGPDGLRDLGEHRLKDLSAPERIYQLGEEEFPRLKSLYGTNLPVAATPFVGRERELAAVAELLARDGVRLLTLTGPGGTGKTRLALQAAGAVAGSYPDGVFWVPLAALREAALVLEQLAEALGVKGDLADHIADKRLLVLFDNFEHLIEAAEDLNELLGSCPNLHLLVTSRELLRVPPEQTYPVPPLDSRDGVELFVARVRAVNPTFEQTPAVMPLCRALENLPLALELAAARASALSPEQLLERLSKRLDLLRAGRGVDPRQRTLRATIEWSYELLDEDERRLFRRVSVFAGGFTLEAAEGICGAELDVIQSLVHKSLVRHADERFSMLETIREYAAEQLAESGDKARTRHTHAMYFASLAERAALDEPTREDQVAWLERLTAEHENFRAALDFADSRGLVDVELRLVRALRSYWFLRGFWSEGRVYLERALGRAETEPAEIRVDLLNECAQLADRQGDYERATALDSEHLRLARELGDERKLANALMRAGIGAEYRGDFDVARVHLRKALAISTGSGDNWFAARARLNLGYSYAAVNDLVDAEDQLEQAADLARTLGNRGLLSACLHGVALVYLMRGLGDAALPQMKEALLLAIEIRSPEQIGETFAVLAGGLAAGGQDEHAARLLGAAKAIREQLALVQLDVIRQQHESTAALLRERLGVERFQAAYADGAEMGIDRGIDFALQTID
jgi:predicted ATPase/class 3 adenylate cyclase